MEDTYPKLCGGTFLALLLHARKSPEMYRKRSPSENNNHRDTDMLAELIKISAPDNYEKPKTNSSQYTSFKTITSQYKSCTIKKSTYLPFLEPTVINDFDNRIKDKDKYKATLEDMKSFVNNFMNDETKPHENISLVEKLLDLIEFDQSIADSDEFFICGDGRSMQKSKLCELSQNSLNVYLPAFLLGIWHFIIVKRTDNAIGKNTIDRWYEKSEKTGEQKNYIGPIKSDIKRIINLIDINEVVSDTNGDSIAVSVLHNKSSQPEQVFDIFDRNIQDFNIEEFIDRNPVDSLVPRFFTDTEGFINRIKCNPKREDILDKNEAIYHQISEFVDILLRYIEYLKQQMKEVCTNKDEINNSYYVHYEPPKSDNGKFEKRTLNYRQKLKSLYKKICKVCKVKTEAASKIYDRAHKTHSKRVKNGAMTQNEFLVWRMEAKHRLAQVEGGELNIAEFEMWLKK
jgi:hypothetical protein